MITETQQTLIDKFIQGKLTDEEQETFARLRTNAEFEQEVAWQTNLQQAVHLQRREVLQEKIKELNKKN